MPDTPFPSEIRGLTQAQVQERRAGGQGNVMPPPTSRTYLQIVRENVFTFINNVLFLLGLGLVLVGRPTDALISVGVILVNVVVSVVQEVRAKRTLDRIALLTRPTATVLREGREESIAPDELVLGDVLKVTPGDQIVLDGTVLQGSMRVDESQLTGESDHIAKQANDQVYSGSFCVSGTGYYRADKVGEDSLANQMTASARAFRRVFTPLQRQINLTIRIILVIVIYLELLIFANGLIKAISLPEGVVQATVVAGLVPNGLFVAIAVAYALAAVRIIRYGALVQQSNAIESLSNVDVLCLDKTGTLTTNQLAYHDLQSYGAGQENVAQALGAMMASASAHNKTSQALAQAFPAEPQPLVAEIPFSSARKWSAVAFGAEPSNGLRGIYALGAPAMLRPYLEQTNPEDPRSWTSLSEQMGRWTGQGLRVLLLAHHPDPGQLQDRGDDSTLPGGTRPLALVSLSDQLRPEAQEALTSFIQNGVNPKIISGDDPTTVAALARQAGLGPDINLVSGLDLEDMSEGEFNEAAEKATIFGRITPQQKERLVDALRQRGHYVAMIGDGVNDVLCLKKADLGIAMQSGTQATRGVADIVLMNDSFAALAPAVAEGQRIVNGMQDILKLFLARITTMAMVILSALVIGVFPINIRHSSLVTMLTVGIPTVVLALWARPGYRYRHSLVSRLAHFVVPPTFFSSLLGLAVFYIPYLYRLGRLDPGLAPEETAQAIATITNIGQTSLASFLLITGLFLVVFVEPPTQWWVGGDSYSGDWRPTWLAIGMLLLFVLVMAVPAGRAFFDLQPIGLPNTLLVLGAALAWLLLVRLVWRQKLMQRFLAADVM